MHVRISQQQFLEFLMSIITPYLFRDMTLIQLALPFYICSDYLIQTIFPNSQPIEPQQNYVIHMLTNFGFLSINRTLLKSQPGLTFHSMGASWDIFHDPNDEHVCPQQILAFLTPSSMPPHHLTQLDCYSPQRYQYRTGCLLWYQTSHNFCSLECNWSRGVDWISSWDSRNYTQNRLQNKPQI